MNGNSKTLDMADMRLFNVPENVKKTIKMLAIEHDRTMNDEAIAALEFYIANQKKK